MGSPHGGDIPEADFSSPGIFGGLVSMRGRDGIIGGVGGLPLASDPAW